MVTGLGFGGGVEWVVWFWWRVTMMGLGDGGLFGGCCGLCKGCGLDKVSMSRLSSSLLFWWFFLMVVMDSRWWWAVGAVTVVVEFFFFFDLGTSIDSSGGG